MHRHYLELFRTSGTGPCSQVTGICTHAASGETSITCCPGGLYDRDVDRILRAMLRLRSDSGADTPLAAKCLTLGHDGSSGTAAGLPLPGEHHLPGRICRARR